MWRSVILWGVNAHDFTCRSLRSKKEDWDKSRSVVDIPETLHFLNVNDTHSSWCWCWGYECVEVYLCSLRLHGVVLIKYRDSLVIHVWAIWTDVCVRMCRHTTLQLTFHSRVVVHVNSKDTQQWRLLWNKTGTESAKHLPLFGQSKNFSRFVSSSKSSVRRMTETADVQFCFCGNELLKYFTAGGST